MSPLPHGSQRSLTVQEVDAWLRAAQARRAQLHCHAASPCESAERQEAFTAMSDLLIEAFEEVRVVSESTRERSHGVRGETVDLRTHAGSVAKLPFRGKIRKSCTGKSMTCESTLSCFR